MSRTISGISKEKLGGPIRDLAKALGCTQEGLARRVGAKFTTFQKWLYGTRPHNDAVRAMRKLAPTQELRDRFPDPDARGLDPQVEWAILAVEVVFERAPETVQSKLMEQLEKWAGQPWFNGPPSPRMKSKK